MQVDGARVDGGEGALGLDRADHLAGGAVDHGDRVRRGRTQRDLARREAGTTRQVAAVARAAELPARDQRVGALAPAVAEDLVVGAARLRRRAAKRHLVGGGQRVGELDPLVGVVEDRRLDRRARGTRPDGGRRTGPARRRRRCRARSPRAGAPPAPTSAAGWRPCPGRSRRSRRPARRCRSPARGRPSRRPPAGPRPRAGPRSRGAAAACSRRGRGRSARPDRRGPGPPGAFG